LLVSLAVSLYYLAPIGTDIHFHLAIARSWAKGELGMFSELPLRVNKMPYPPLFEELFATSTYL